MAIADRFKVQPDANTEPPPYGAPENGLALDRINDTFRVVMAGVRETWDALGELRRRLGDLAFQARNNVLIEDGIVNAKAIKGGANAGYIPASALLPPDDEAYGGVRVGGLTPIALQRLYNWSHPIGSFRLWHNTTGAGLVWPGTTATWEMHPNAIGALLVGSNVDVAPGAQAGFRYLQATTSTTGAHGHGGQTAAHTLTVEQMPAHTHEGRTVANLTSGGFTNMAVGTDRRLVAENTGSAGGGQGHRHNIASDGDHFHDVFLDQTLRFGLAVWRRVA